MKIDLGDDASSDTVMLAAENLISKKLKISNFNRGDKLIVDGDVFTCSIFAIMILTGSRSVLVRRLSLAR